LDVDHLGRFKELDRLGPAAKFDHRLGLVRRGRTQAGGEPQRRSTSRQRCGGFVWRGLKDPKDADLMALASEFSAWVAIVAVPTMVAGIYGMNFDNMPELRWHHGYFVILGGMLLIMIALYLDFKRNKWL
jgi:hypothetical protein